MRDIKNSALIHLASILFLFLAFTSCGLFDKELRQDKHIENFRKQLAEVQDSLDTHYERVKAYKTIINLIDEDDAIITLRKKNMLLIDANNYVSDEYIQAHNYNKALKYSNISINLDSSSAKGYFNRGGIYQAIGDDSLAMIDYTYAIKLNENYADAYYNRGIIHEKSQKYKEALDDYNKAIKHQPRYVANIYNNRGNTYLALKDSLKALDDYNKVLYLDTTNVCAYSNRASLYIRLKEPDKALADCNKAISIDSTYVRLYNQRAEVYVLKKDYEEAIEDYEKILELDPHNKYKINTKARESIKKLRPLVKKK